MKCSECPEYNKCVFEHDLRAKRRNCGKAKQKKVVTNADRIKAISNKELAEIFVHACADGCPPYMNWDCAKDGYGWDACVACWMKWLQQPVEEDDQ